jgi:hypothetical protein
MTTTRTCSANPSSTVLPRSVGAEVARGTALLLLGVVLPALVHLVPTSVPLGPVLMPRLIPVALAAFLLPARSAFSVCVLMPFLSMAATGMPPLPIALELVAEGAVLVSVIRLLVRAGLPWWGAFAAAALASRLVAGAVLVVAMGAQPAPIAATLAKGLWGLALAGLMLPGLFRLFRSDVQE